jgi:hypothetical protein
MSDPVRSRAMFALFHAMRREAGMPPYGSSECERLHELSDYERLRWAAQQSDRRLLRARNLGIVTLRWIRAHEGAHEGAPASIHGGDW